MVSVKIYEAIPEEEENELYYVQGEEMSDEEFEFLPNVGDEVTLRSTLNYIVRKVHHFAKGDVRGAHTEILVEKPE